MSSPSPKVVDRGENELIPIRRPKVSLSEKKLKLTAKSRNPKRREMLSRVCLSLTEVGGGKQIDCQGRVRLVVVNDLCLPYNQRVITSGSAFFKVFVRCRLIWWKVRLRANMRAY